MYCRHQWRGDQLWGRWLGRPKRMRARVSSHPLLSLAFATMGFGVLFELLRAGTGVGGPALDSLTENWVYMAVEVLAVGGLCLAGGGARRASSRVGAHDARAGVLECGRRVVGGVAGRSVSSPVPLACGRGVPVDVPGDVWRADAADPISPARCRGRSVAGRGCGGAGGRRGGRGAWCFQTFWPRARDGSSPRR